MAQIQKGTTYSTGDQVTATNLNALADAAILLPGAITDQTAKTVPLAADTVLIHSAADTALRKSTLTQLFSNATGIPLTTGVTGILPAANGGTGVNNGANTITIAGNVTHAGAFTQSFTATANTSLTLPVTGTLATLAGSESLSNKTITASAFNGTVGATTRSTVAATTVNANSGITLSNASNPLLSIQDTTATTGPSVFVQAASTIGSGEGLFGTTSNHPLGFYINAVKYASLTTTGLAVTGALSSTTGANFATSSGNVGVGVASPLAKLSVVSSSGITSYGSGNSPTLSVHATNRLSNAEQQVVTVFTTDNPTIDFGGSIGLGGRGVLATAEANAFAQIAGRKENSTDSNLAGYFQISTSNSGSDLTERMRIDSSGNVGIGVTPQTWVSTGNQKAIQISECGSISSLSASTGNQQVNFGRNVYDFYSAKYITSDNASAFRMQGDNSFAWFTAPSGTAGAAITFTQAMTLDATGNLVVGNTTCPYISSGRTVIGINGTSSSILALQSAGVNRGYLYADNSTFSIEVEATTLKLNAVSASPITFYTSNTERARIDSSGNLLVGTTDTGFNARQLVRFEATGASTNGIAIWNGGGSGAVFAAFANSSGGFVGTITQVATTGVLYNTTSDYRRKFNVKNLTGSGTFIDALKPRTFDWDSGDKGVGFIAHEFAEVCPSAVTGEKDAVDEDGKPKYQTMQASSAEVIANLVAELQSLRQRVAALESN